jgi:hypothetical protein
MSCFQRGTGEIRDTLPRILDADMRGRNMIIICKKQDVG